MKNRALKLISTAFIAILLTRFFCGGFLLAYFSDLKKTDALIATGSVSALTENLEFKSNLGEWSKDGGTINDATLKEGDLGVISFTVKNSGKSTAEYGIGIELAFEGNLKESGHLIAFSGSFSDEEIEQSIQNGSFEGALIDVNADDTAAVITQDGAVAGISEIIETGILQSGEIKTVVYKIYFKSGAGSLIEAARYNDKKITVNIKVSADIDGRTTKWGSTNTDSFTVTVAVDFSALPFIDKMAGGVQHVLALTSLGQVYSWGRNVDGQLGDGSRLNKSVPTIVSGLDNIIDIAACDSTSYALRSDGKLYSWGHNGYGHLGNGDGQLEDTTRPVEVINSGGEKYIRVFARYNTAGAITADGNAYVWGYGGEGAIGNGLSVNVNSVPQKLSVKDVARLDFGKNFGTALTNEGKLYTWGSNVYGTIGIGSSDSNIHSPTAVTYFDSTEGIEDVCAGYFHMAVLTKDKKMFTWGYGSNGRLGVGQISYSGTPQYVNLPLNVKSIAAGYSNSAAILENGTVYAFGDNRLNKLNGGAVEDIINPLHIDGISGAEFILLMYETTFIVTNGSVVNGIGNGEYGKLGTGNTNNSEMFVEWELPK